MCRSWLRLIGILLLLCTAGCAEDAGRMGSSEDAPRLPYRDRGHSVLLLLNGAEHGRVPADPEERNYDLEWANLLAAHFGGCDIADLRELQADGSALLEGRRLLVLPRRCLASMDSSFAPIVDAAVRVGLDVLAELPDRGWSERVGLRRNALEQRSPLPWPQPTRNDLRRPELSESPPAALELQYTVGSYWPGRGALGSPRTLGSPTGRPLLWNHPMGRGVWILLAMDFGRLASQLRQGVPADDFRLRARHEELLDPELNPADLIAAPALLRSDWPWLDRWTVSLLDDRHATSPWPRLWPTPPDADGWLVAVEREPRNWGPGLDLSLVELTRAGAAFDASFGPDGAGRGWSFGSGLPFHALSVDGGMHRVWELPHLGAHTEPLSSWMRRNAEGAQGPLALRLPLPVLSERAPTRLHRASGPEELFEFWERRSEAILNWSFDGNLLNVRVDCRPGDAPLTLALPLRWLDLTLAAWEMDAADPASRRTRSFDRAYLRVALPDGASTLRVRYEPMR